MRYKKSMILMLITIFLFSIACVCATDTNNASANIIEVNELDDSNTLNLDEKDNVIQNSNDEDQIQESEGSFDDLNNAINNNNNDTITLTKNYKYGENDASYKFGIKISRPVTINGNGITIDGSNTACIFDINGTNVVINNINFINGKNNDEGGAIIWRGENGIISNSILSNNHAEYGGAIVWEGINGKIINTILDNNNAASNGGAVYWKASNGKIIESTFKDNEATSYGGAILWTGNYGTLTKSTLQNNTAEYGGAINWYATHGIVSSCLFLDNIATSGSAYYNDYEPGSSSKLNDNIFFNNPGDAIHFDIFEYSNADYNWFGNAADNYANKPSALEGLSDIWLFLNVTANPNEIPISGISDVVFKLYSCDKYSQVSEYDNSLLIPLNLKITSDNGNVDKNNVTLGEIFHYNATDGNTGTVTAKIGNIISSIEIKHYKLNPNLTAEALEISYGENTVIYLSYSSTANGTVNITLNGKNNRYTFENINLNTTISLGETINADEYDITVTYSGNAIYFNDVAHTTFKVNKVNSTINASDITFNYGLFGYTIITSSGATGISANIIGQDNTAIASTSTVLVFGLDAGSYEMELTTIPDGNHNAITKTVSITVNKIKTNILTSSQVTANYGDSARISMTLKDVNGNSLTNKEITVTLNNVKYNVKTNAEGQASITVPNNLAAKTYSATVTFNGDTNYDKNTINVNVIVKKVTPKITAAKKTYKVKVKTKKYVIVLKDNKQKAIKSAKVTLKVKGKTYSAKTNSKGKATFKITKLTKKGKFKATIKYTGKGNFNGVTKTVLIKIK